MVWTLFISHNLGNSRISLAHWPSCSYDSYPEYEPPEDVWNTILASVALDYIFAGSELVHRVKLHKERNKTEYQDIEMQEQTQKINQ